MLGQVRPQVAALQTPSSLCTHRLINSSNSPPRLAHNSCRGFRDSIGSHVQSSLQQINLKQIQPTCQPNKVIIIIGGSRGIGEGLAKSCLDLQQKVFITGQSDNSINKVLTKLDSTRKQNNQTHNAQQLHSQIRGQVCDVRKLDDIEAVWDSAIDNFGRVDYWITCAGITQSPSETQSMQRLVDMRGAGLKDIVDVNLTGALNCASVVIPRMEKQGHGHFYLFEGFGSDGFMRTGFAAYGASKVAIQYLTKALAKENQEAKSPVKVSSLAPGIVITDLLKNAYAKDSKEWQRDKKVYEILADPVAPVAHFLAKQVLHNTQNGNTISWLTPAKAIGRFLTAPFGKRNNLD